MKWTDEDTCIYCNKLGSTPSGDHVPPKCFFLKKPGCELLTVPACLPCNQLYSKSDGLVSYLLGAHHIAEKNKTVQERIRSSRKRAWARDRKMFELFLKCVNTSTGMTNFDQPFIDDFFLRMGRALIFTKDQIYADVRHSKWRFSDKLNLTEEVRRNETVHSNGYTSYGPNNEFRYMVDSNDEGDKYWCVIELFGVEYFIEIELK